MDVWVLRHVPPSGDYVLVGLYTSRDTALAAVGRLSGQPGFREHPDVVDDIDDPGFFIEPYTLDQDHWTEGHRAELA